MSYFRSIGKESRQNVIWLICEINLVTHIVPNFDRPWTAFYGNSIKELVVELSVESTLRVSISNLSETPSRLPENQHDFIQCG